MPARVLCSSSCLRSLDHTHACRRLDYRQAFAVAASMGLNVTDPDECLLVLLRSPNPDVTDGISSNLLNCEYARPRPLAVQCATSSTALFILFALRQ